MDDDAAEAETLSAPRDGAIRVAGVLITVRGDRGILPKGVTMRTATAPGQAKRLRGSTAPLRFMKSTAAYEPEAVVTRVVEVLGNNVTAGLLGVAKDRPTRWAKGIDRPSEESRSRLADLDALIGQLLAVFTAEQAQLWLEGEDPYLQARPLDVFRLEGPSRVIAAMQAYEQGAFA